MIDPEIARQRATIAAHAKWANETDRTGATAALRAGFLGKLQREAREKLGPAATDEQVAKAADNALKAHYAKMRLNSLKARRKVAQQKREEFADAILSEPDADDSAA
jgi:hypothetical protein